MTWRLLAELALLLAAATAIVVARRVPAHRPVAIFLGAVVVADLVRRGLAAGPLPDMGPHTGATRLLFHIDQALYLLWPFGLAGLAGAVLAERRRPWVLASVYLATVVVLALGYPTVRRELLGQAYLCIELVALLICLEAAAAPGWRRGRPGLTTVVTLALIVVDVATVAGGPFARPLFAHWYRAWPMHAVLYVAIGLMQGGGIAWNSRATR